MDAAELKRAEPRWAQIQKALTHVERWLGPEVERVARTYEAGQPAGLHGVCIGPDEARRAVTSDPRPVDALDLDGAAMDLPEWPRLSAQFGLGSFDGCVLMLALAPEIETRFARLYGFVQDDLSRAHPGFDLILTLLSGGPADRLALRRRLAPDAPLFAHRLVHSRREPGGLWLASQVLLDPQILRLITGDSGLDERLADFARRVLPGAGLARVADQHEAPVRIAAAKLKRGRPMLAWLDGPDRVAKRRVALEAAHLAGLPMIEIDETGIPGDRPPARTAALLVREGALQDAVLYLDGLDDDGQEPCPFCAALIAELHQQGGMAFLAGGQAWLRSGWAAHGLTRIAVPRPGREERERIWEQSLMVHGLTLSPDQTRTLSRRYRLTGNQIETAVAVAAAMEPETCEEDASIWSPGPTFGRVVIATRAQTGRKIGALAARRRPSAKWDDLVLPEDSLRQLRELCRRVDLRDSVLSRWAGRQRTLSARGVHALFAGSSGTGKTMAAEIIADELGLDLFRISLPNTVSKFIGETEKNLDRIFDAAEDSNAILFFDEADSILGKRSEVRDSHDRYANLEISYLLQRMEEFDGVSILASNLRANIDDAFTRRLAFVIHFPFPDAAHRRLIWEGAWPNPAWRPRDLDLDKLAAAFKLSGGSISNIAVAASFLAAEADEDVNVGHVVTALRREYQKLGKPTGEAELYDSLAPGAA
jgi:AAA+ superfamily predicted ATPase